MARRYKVLFKSEDAFNAAQAIEAPGVRVPVRHASRLLMAVEEPSWRQEHLEVQRAFAKYLGVLEGPYRARIVEDFQFQLDVATPFDPNAIGPDDPGAPSLEDVLEQIRAPDAWRDSRGRGITIAVVDTGIAGTRPEFPLSKRAGQWQPIGEDAWTDYHGHGSMCACIAAGTREEGGVFNGVAPDAKLIACRTYFYDTELTAVYDYLAGLAREGSTIVASNSFGITTGSPPPDPSDLDFLNAMQDAIDAGVLVFFSAGNNHDLAHGAPAACHPTSIWLHKCRADIMSVATCKLDGTMWYYSSRGPGQKHGQAGMNPKPDVTAPTPENGRIVWGDTIKTLPNGWGTSGACPQAAGLAALLLAWRPGLTRDQVYDGIRGTAVGLGWRRDCEGAGRIDCRAALDGT